MNEYINAFYENETPSPAKLAYVLHNATLRVEEQVRTISFDALH